MLPDQTTTLFLALVICIFLILFAHFIKSCFETLGPSHEKQHAELLEPDVNVPNTTDGYFDTCNFPSPKEDPEKLNNAMYVSDTDTSDSSYTPSSPDELDSNHDDMPIDSIWVRRRPRIRRLRRTPSLATMPSRPSTPLPMELNREYDLPFQA